MKDHHIPRLALVSSILTACSAIHLHAQCQIGSALGGLTPLPSAQPITIIPTDISLKPVFGDIPSPPKVKENPAPRVLPVMPQAPEVKPLPQWHGQYEGDAAFASKIIRTKQAWTGFWNSLNKPVPQILDEAKEMAVFIAIGERPTGGYKPAVISAKVIDNKMIVEYTDGKPSPDMFVTQVISHPWMVAIIPATQLPLVFKKHE